MTNYTHLENPLGELLLTSRGGRLTGLYFVDQAHVPPVEHDWKRDDDAEIFIRTGQQLAEYIAGERIEFDVPLELMGTPFQARVWQVIAAIPFGQTITYGELAEQIGAPQSVRAVGAATGRNPVSWIVPCHRVMGKSGALTGYAGGVSRKKALLDFEASRLARQEAVLTLKESQPALEMV